MIIQEVFTTVMFYSKRARDYLALSLYNNIILLNIKNALNFGSYVI